MQALAWLLGLDDLDSIQSVDLSLAANWAEENAFWVILATLGLFLAAMVIYVRRQSRGSLAMRAVLGASRGLLLALLFLTLAIPVLRIGVVTRQPPKVYLVLDGTESMAIEDQYSREYADRLNEAVGRTGTGPATRLAYLQAALARENNPLQQLLARGYEVDLFVFEGTTTSQLRKLNGQPWERDPARLRTQLEALAGELPAEGQVTALGAMLADMRRQYGAANLACAILVSDFAQNSGRAPLGSRTSPALQLGTPLYTVGVGAPEAIDVIAELQTDPKMKRAERTSLVAKIRQTGALDEEVTVVIKGRPLSGGAVAEPQEIGRQKVTLRSQSETVSVPFTPDVAGRYELTVEVDAVEGEVIAENNRAVREVNIIDDYLRLMYVAHEPNWEWRFVKEVFHRDKLVGMEGFRTYLGSSDPRVRQTNVLFLPTLTPTRKDFFANDVIFLGDMPNTALSPRFNEMVKEFVSEHGGGLVVIAGPRFGPAQLLDTPLAEMLPVRLDRNLGLRDAAAFDLGLTHHARRYPFMQLGDDDAENQRAWENLGELPWYRPVAAVHEQASVLAEHPTDLCGDGRTRQPLIAVRPYGKGEVVYLGFDEMWRLRKLYGEKYYRRFWSQLIYRLGMSHVIGADKRFRPRLNAPRYQVEDKVLVTVEAYDENYEPLTEAQVEGGMLSGELIAPGQGPGGESRSLAIPYLRRGVFEAAIPVYAAGEYSLRIQDPVTKEFQQLRFDVVGVSAERLRGTRDLSLQQELASQTGGRSYDLSEFDRLVEDLRFVDSQETSVTNRALWNTPLWFAAIVLLMLGEWFFRKMVHLS